MLCLQNNQIVQRLLGKEISTKAVIHFRDRKVDKILLLCIPGYFLRVILVAFREPVGSVILILFYRP